VNIDRTSTDQLAARMREAYEQKHTRECMTLIKNILSADPEHVEAKTVQSAIQAQISRDLNDARALLEDSHTKDDGQKYRKAAEIILIKTLNLDPSNEEAKALLSLTRGVTEGPWKHSSPAAPSAEARSDPQTVAEFRFTVAASSATKEGKKEATSFKIPLVVVAAVVLLVVLGVFGKSYLKNWGTTTAADASRPADEVPSSAQTVPVEPSAPPPITTEPQHVAITSSTNTNANSVAPVPVSLLPAAPDVKPAPSKPAARDAQPDANSSKPAPPPAEPAAPVASDGTLAVSSLIPADIYRDDKLIGSTPATLQLPAGRQTLEYRHGDLRTQVTHNIKSKETSTALITFETVVQINARPWAQVFIDGATRRPLGQTPLSNVRVPIGSVLVFENPNFPSKNHRVTDKETAIQVVFP
jgi:hypothetical protein